MPHSTSSTHPIIELKHRRDFVPVRILSPTKASMLATSLHSSTSCSSTSSSTTTLLFCSGGSFGLSMHVQQRVIDFYMKEINLKNADNNANQRRYVSIERHEHEKLLQFTHPNIVQSFGWFEENCDGDTYHVSVREFCEGGSLADFIANLTEALPEWLIQQWLKQLGRAVGYLHNSDYVHRDLQPKNVLLSRADHSGIIKLSNFGLVESVFNVETQDFTSDILLHSPNFWPYSAPELWQFKIYTKQCDIWSIGVIAYELANLKRPFQGNDPGVVAAILFNEPEPFSDNNCGYSEKLNDFIMKMLEKDPKIRPSIDEMLEDAFMEISLERPSASQSSETTSCSSFSTPASCSLLSSCSSSTTSQNEDGKDTSSATESSGTSSSSTVPSSTVEEPKLDESQPTEELGRLADIEDRLIEAEEEKLQLEEFEQLEDQLEVGLPTDDQNVNFGSEIDVATDEVVVVYVPIPSELLPQVLQHAAETGDVDLLRNVLMTNSDEARLILIPPPPIFENTVVETSSTMHPLHAAAKLGHLEVCRLLIEQFEVPVDLTAPSSNASRTSALNEAAENGQVSVVDFLVSEKESDVELRSLPSGRTPFLQAVAAGHLETVRYLVEQAQCDVEAVDYLTKSPALHLALDAGHFEVAEYLLEKRPEMIEARSGDADLALLLPFGDPQLEGLELIVNNEKQLQNNQNRTPLLQACHRGNLEAVKFLVERGASFDVHCNWANYLASPLHLATLKGHLGCVDFLLKSRPELLSTTTIFDDNALNLAATEGHFSLVEYLVNWKKVEIDHRGLMGRTPLMQAASRGHLKVFKFLAERGADLYARDDNFMFKQNRNKKGLASASIHLAADQGFIHIVSYLLDRSPAMLELKDSEGGTALNRCCSKGQLKMAKYLLSNRHQANLENRGHLGRTPFLEACVIGNLALVAFLVDEKGANMLAKDSELENNCLHLAGHFGHASLVHWLCDAADRQCVKQRLLDMKNAMGHTALSYARMCRQVEIVRLLEQKGASFS